MFLLRGGKAAVALGVGLRHRHAQVPLPAHAAVGLYPGVVVAAELPVHAVADQGLQGEQGVAADLLDQQHHSSARAGRALDHFAAVEQVGGISRGLEVAAAQPASVAVLPGHQGTVRGLFGQVEIEGGVLDGDAQVGVGGHVLHLLSPGVDHASVAQALLVFRRGSQAHGSRPSFSAVFPFSTCARCAPGSVPARTDAGRIRAPGRAAAAPPHASADHPLRTGPGRGRVPRPGRRR